MREDVDALGQVLFYAQFRSRRMAKRLLRECGGEGSAAELDRILSAIQSHPDRAAIYAHAAALREAQVESERALAQPCEDRDHDSWIVGEGAASGRTYICYIGPDTAFLAEVFEDARDCPAGAKWCDADDGQVIGNVLWLDDGAVPKAGDAARLRDEAVRQLRIFDARIGLCDDDEHDDDPDD